MWTTSVALVCSPWMWRSWETAELHDQSSLDVCARRSVGHFGSKSRQRNFRFQHGGRGNVTVADYVIFPSFLYAFSALVSLCCWLGARFGALATELRTRGVHCELWLSGAYGFSLTVIGIESDIWCLWPLHSAVLFGRLALYSSLELAVSASLKRTRAEMYVFIANELLFLIVRG